MVDEISVRRPDIVLINMKKAVCHIQSFAVPADCRLRKMESETWRNMWTLLRSKKKVLTITPKNGRSTWSNFHKPRNTRRNLDCPD